MTSSFLLTKKQMESLTGSPDADLQIQVLVANRIPYILRCDGSPRTTQAAIDARLLGVNSDELEDDGFNLDAISE